MLREYLLDQRRRVGRASRERVGVGEGADARRIGGTQRARLLQRDHRGRGVARLLEQQHACADQRREALGHVAAGPGILEREVGELVPRAGLLVDTLQPVAESSDPAAPRGARVRGRPGRRRACLRVRTRRPAAARCRRRRAVLLEGDQPPQRCARAVPALQGRLQARERLERGLVARILANQIAEQRPRLVHLPRVGQDLCSAQAQEPLGRGVPGALGSRAGVREPRRECPGVGGAIDPERGLHVLERTRLVARRAPHVGAARQQGRARRVGQGVALHERRQLADGGVGGVRRQRGLDQLVQDRDVVRRGLEREPQRVARSLRVLHLLLEQRGGLPQARDPLAGAVRDPASSTQSSASLRQSPRWRNAPSRCVSSWVLDGLAR